MPVELTRFCARRILENPAANEDSMGMLRYEGGSAAAVRDPSLSRHDSHPVLSSMTRTTSADRRAARSSPRSIFNSRRKILGWEMR